MANVLRALIFGDGQKLAARVRVDAQKMRYLVRSTQRRIDKNADRSERTLTTVLPTLTAVPAFTLVLGGGTGGEVGNPTAEVGRVLVWASHFCGTAGRYCHY
jgi:hypothetical protein